MKAALAWKCAKCGRVLFESETEAPFPAQVDKCCGFAYRIELKDDKRAEMSVSIDKSSSTC